MLRGGSTDANANQHPDGHADADARIGGLLIPDPVLVAATRAHHTYRPFVRLLSVSRP